MEVFWIGRTQTCNLILVIIFQVQFYRGICQLDWEDQPIHRVWPSLRETEKLQSNSTDNVTMTFEQGENMNTSGSSTTLVYGSPICIGRCIILQIFWSNSSTHFLGVKLPKFPTFPRPRKMPK